MLIYTLYQSNDKIVRMGTMVDVMKVIMNIAQENSVPEVTYDKEEGATCFEFEGNYCNFKLYLSHPVMREEK